MHLSLISTGSLFWNNTAGKLCSRLVENNQPANKRYDALLQYKTGVMLPFSLR